MLIPNNFDSLFKESKLETIDTILTGSGIYNLIEHWANMTKKTVKRQKNIFHTLGLPKTGWAIALHPFFFEFGNCRRFK